MVIANRLLMIFVTYTQWGWSWYLTYTELHLGHRYHCHTQCTHKFNSSRHHDMHICVERLIQNFCRKNILTVSIETTQGCYKLSMCQTGNCIHCPCQDLQWSLHTLPANVAVSTHDWSNLGIRSGAPDYVNSNCSHLPNQTLQMVAKITKVYLFIDQKFTGLMQTSP